MVGTEAETGHPLLQRNTSDLQEQRFTTTFVGTEALFAERLASGEKILSEFASLEMALAAARQAAGSRAAAGEAIALRNVVWGNPVVVNGHAQHVHVALLETREHEIAYEIYSDGGARDGAVHLQGAARFVVPADRGRDHFHARLKQVAASAPRSPGSSIRWMQPIAEGEMFAELVAPARVSAAVRLHPMLLDAVVQEAGRHFVVAGANGQLAPLQFGPSGFPSLVRGAVRLGCR